MSTTRFNNLSRIANNFIRETHPNDNILYVDEEITHDDFDHDGPLSNLHDLCVVINDLENMQEIHYYYHCENWYTGTPTDYTFYLEYTKYISKKTDNSKSDEDKKTEDNKTEDNKTE